MEFSELASRRRMVRSFDGTPVPSNQLRHWCEVALWAPTAGNSAGVRFIVIEADRVAEYFAVATDADWRASARRAEGLMRAGAVVLAVSLPSAYTERYGEADKASSGLSDESAWPVPYWHTDAAMATMQLLLAVDEASWSACFWGNFRNEADILKLAGLSGEWRLFGSVLIGRADEKDPRSASLTRATLSRSERVLGLP